MTKTETSHLKQKVCYIFQGGGALGSYQMGAYEALKDSGYSPDMIVGISIGSINASIIAGNKPEHRKEKLRTFWDKVTTETSFPFNYFGMPKIPNWIGAQSAIMNGQPGFFKPKILPPTDFLKHTPDELGYYDTSPLRETLLELIDFDYLNQGHVRLCLGSVELGSGEFTFFDNHKQTISAEHIMASGALPPGFPPVKIDEKYYIDGGVFSNSPVFKVIDEFVEHPEDRRRILCFMVDVFSAKGPYPHSMDGMAERVKDIQYSSRSKRATDLYATSDNLSTAIRFLANKLTPEQRKDPKIKEVIKLGQAHQIDIVHLIYHSPTGTELESKDYNFSKEACDIHREMGYENTKELYEQNHSKWDKKHESGLSIYTLDGDIEVD